MQESLVHTLCWQEKDQHQPRDSVPPRGTA